MRIPTGYVDGEIAPLGEIRVPILDRGFLYGDSIYEVFRTHAGIPYLFDEHYARLMNSARLSKMQVRQRKEEIVDAIIATIAAGESSEGGKGAGSEKRSAKSTTKSDSKTKEDVYVRYQISRGQDQIDLFPDPKLQSRLVIMVKPVPNWDARLYQHGITLAIPSVRRNAVDALNPNIKGGNYLNNILGLAEARALGADECLMLDTEARVTECSTSNVWFGLDGALVTPARGNLHGITRKSLVGCLQDAGLRDLERELHGEELTAANECFVTSTTRAVMPVAELRLQDGVTVRFPPGGGELTRMAMKLHSDMVDKFVRENRVRAWF